MKRFIALILALLCSPAFAQVPMTGAGLGAPASGGASPTWTNQTSATKTTCGFSGTCTIMGVTVASGFNVVAAGGANQAGASSNITSVTLCGTLLTTISNATVPTSSMMLGLAYGTVTGGSCSVVVTTNSNGLSVMGIALGLLNNLTSTTPGTGCVGLYNNTASPFPCTSSITVSSGGFAIGAIVSLSNVALTSSNMTIDSQSAAVGGSIAIGNSSATGSITPSFGANAFDTTAVAAAPWR